jgi:diguanylate cyclase (GGDEF)-like protein
MKNQLFLSYFLDHFEGASAHMRWSRRHAPTAVLALCMCAWLLWLAGGGAPSPAIVCAVTLLSCLAGAGVAWRGTRERTGKLSCLASALLATNNDCLKLLSLDGHILQLSESGAELMECASADMAGADWLGFWTGADAVSARQALARARAGERASFTGSLSTTKGRLKWWDSTLRPVFDARGAVCAVLCASRDITLKTVALQEAQRAATLLADIEKHIPVVFWSLSPDFRTVHYVSARFETMWQMPVDGLRADPDAWRARILSADQTRLRAAMWEMSSDGKPRQADFRLRLDDGTLRWIHVDASPVRNGAGVIERIISVCVDVTDDRMRTAELDRLAHTDNLTGLANRLALMRHVQALCDGGNPFSLLFADIDRFKILNDTAGAAAADGLLREVGAAIRSSAPPEALVARAGGDEFVIVLAGALGDEDLSTIYDDLRRGVGRPLLLGATTTSVTLSAGVARFPEHGRTPDTLMSSADVAKDAAKRSGRSTYRVFGSDEVADIDRFQLERDLWHALERNEFILHYQPTFYARSGALAGVEALIRWHPAGRALVSPGVFVPLLEDTGLIHAVGEWVFERSLRQVMQWCVQCGVDVLMAVNVSAKQLLDVRLPYTFLGIAQRLGVAPNRIVLEITESAFVGHIERAKSAVGKLQQMGFQIALDDFGTGYSSLSYLTCLRPDVLKLDKSLVRDIDSDASARVVAGGVVALAKGLNMRVVAEGVERDAQLDILVEMQCDVIQGFLLGRPEPAASLTARLASPVVENRTAAPESVPVPP